jgi:rod shape-determining protein MreD
MRNIILLLVFFYLLFVFQTSFLVHFPIRGWVLNIVFIAIFLFNILEKPEKNNGILAAAILGFFWDIFSENFIGYHVLMLVFLALLIKTILVRYVRIKIFAPR